MCVLPYLGATKKLEEGRISSSDGLRRHASVKNSHEPQADGNDERSVNEEARRKEEVFKLQNGCSALLLRSVEGDDGRSKDRQQTSDLPEETELLLVCGGGSASESRRRGIGLTLRKMDDKTAQMTTERAPRGVTRMASVKA
jgi:hypothetical protein